MKALDQIAVADSLESNITFSCLKRSHFHSRLHIGNNFPTPPTKIGHPGSGSLPSF